MRPEIEGSPIDASDYFASCSLGVTWQTYENFKELAELRRSTTVIGYLPIDLVILLALDVAEMMDSLRGEKEGINYG